MLGARSGQLRRQASWGVGLGGSSREGGLGAERRIRGGLCECLVRGQGSREGKQAGEWAWVVGAGWMGLGPRRESVERSVSAWCEVRVAERARKVGRGRGW